MRGCFRGPESSILPLIRLLQRLRRQRRQRERHFHMLAKHPARIHPYYPDNARSPPPR